MESVQQQQVETIKSNEPSSEPEKHEQTEHHAMESEIDNERPSESEKQQSEEYIDDNPPPLEMEQQHQKEQEETTHTVQSTVTSEEPPQQAEQDTAVTSTEGENMDVTTPKGDNDKEDEVAMETNVEPPQSTPETNQAPNEDEHQPELMPTVQDEQPQEERIEHSTKEPEVEEDTEPQNEITSKGEEGSVEMKEPEQISNEEAPVTAVASMEDNVTETEEITEEPPKDSTVEPEQIMEERPNESTAELKETEHITEMPPSGEQQPVKDRVAAESFTLELDEDPLGNSSIFMEDEHSNEVLVDPDTSPPASKKRKGKPRKLGTRTTRSRVCTCVRVRVCVCVCVCFITHVMYAKLIYNLVTVFSI